MELAGPDDHLVRGGGGGYLGLAAWAAGDVREALSRFGDATRSLHAAGNLVDELDGTIVLADLHVASGHSHRARRLYEQGLQTATGTGPPYPRATADLYVGLAELDLELDEVDGAEAHLETARALGARASITENRHRWFVAMAQLRAARGDYGTATGLLDEAQALYRHGFYPDVRPIAAIKARICIAAGDLEPAAGWAHDRGVGAGDDPDYLREYEHLTLVRLLLAQHRDARQRDAAGSASAAAQALGLLHRLHAAATDAGRDGSTLEIRALQALAHHAEGDLPQALAALSRALAGASEPESRVRLFLDEGPTMVALLRLAADATALAVEQAGGVPDDTLRAHARRLLDRAQPLVASTEPLQSLTGPLSQRELQVLRLLDSELTGPEIARELYVTVNTLRTHTKRIFTKLEANTRASAVQRARELGLL
jgi:LuxR family maltose regulon positive regulatory protein